MIKLELTQEQWETLRDGVADVACWHYGFEAAKPDYQGPPQLRGLIDVIGILKHQVRQND